MVKKTFNKIMKNIPVSKFRYLKIGDEFIGAPLPEEEVNSEKPFHVFKKIKRTFGIHGQHNAKRRIDSVLSHMPPNMSVILLKDIPKDIAIK